MNSEPLPVNQQADLADKIIAAMNSTGVKFVETLMIADYPWLGLPGVRQIFELSLGILDGYISKAVQNGVAFGVIDLQIEKEKSNLSKALAELIAAEKTGNSDEIKLAIQKYANAHSALVHNDGSAPAQ